MSQLKRLFILGVLGICVLSILPAIAANDRGLDRANFDTICSPCADFHQYANGNWLANNPIPAAYSTWGMSEEMDVRNYDMLHVVLEDAAKAANPTKGSNLQKIGDFYAVAMDSARIESEGLSPLGKYLAPIEKISDVAGLTRTIAEYHADGARVLFDVDADQDMKNTEQVILYASQGGLGLPDRDYYTKTDDESAKIRQAYVKHIAAMLVLLGDSPERAKTSATAIMALETKLAEASLTNVALQDPANSYNMVTVAEADAQTPFFLWTKYLKASDLPEIMNFSMAQPNFFAEMNKQLMETPISDWKDYLRWHLVRRAAPYLSSAFVNENFKFYSATLRGTKELRPRWKRVLSVLNNDLGEALGELYVAKVFPPESKRRALALVENLKTAFRARLMNLTWMSNETRAKALVKLDKFTVKIGYPDKWRDYSALDIDRSSYLDNVWRARKFEAHRKLVKIGKPVDRNEWLLPPQIINAYYNPLMNELAFPAAILQPPFFDAGMDDAVNYGAMGGVIGHEMTHGFDNFGSKFDADGTLNEWWTTADRAEFEKRTAELIKLYDTFVAVDTFHVNGELTLGENIADLGGLLTAYDALQLALAGKEKKLIDGLTPEQRFFLSWAQFWRNNEREESTKLKVNTDEHPPDKFRTNGPLKNITAFAKAFGCSQGQSMVRDEKDLVHIW